MNNKFKTTKYLHRDFIPKLLLASFFAGFCQVAAASFSGTYAPSNWTTTTTGAPPAGGSVVDDTGAPNSIAINGGNAGCTGICELDYTITIPTSGTISFNWDYLTTDVDGPSFETFSVLINGINTQLSNNGGPNAQNGLFSINVNAGDVFGFRLNCTDCVLGPANIIISNFNAPGNASPIPSLSVLALILFSLLIVFATYHRSEQQRFEK